MASATTLRPDKDFSKEVDIQIPEAQKLAESNVQAAIEKLTALEKQTRQASDLASTTRILDAIVTICYDSKDYSLLNEQVLILSKKHGQLKQATTSMVQTVMGFLEKITAMETKLTVIETLRTVTEGKIFVEVERARVTKILSDIKKDHYADTKAARDILCELQVETFGSMDRREKIEFILEQVSLCILTEDFTQAGILSRKITTKYLSRDDATDLKLRYYEQQIILSKHDKKYLEVCKHYRQVLDTKDVADDPNKLRPVLQRIIYFIILAPYDNEQHDLMQRIHRDSKNTQVPEEAELLKLFTVQELMRWPKVAENFGQHLCSTDVFDAHSGASSDAKAYERWDDLRKRVIEHNVRVIAKYYTSVRLDRLCQLLDLSQDETETYLSELVVSKMVFAKIDRPARIVSFAKPRDTDDVLNEWSHNMKDLLELLGRIEHLITKEEMMASIRPTSKAGKDSKKAVAA